VARTVVRSRRVGYERLRERLYESGLPWDNEAERAAIGAVLLAPNGHSKRLVRRAYSGPFYDPAHGWLWEELGTALVKCKLLLEDEARISEWLSKSHVLRRYREKHGAGLRQEIGKCLDCFWWHGDWYVNRVLEAAKVRAKIEVACNQLQTAMEAAEDWRRVNA
jgi:replicative DNA helicase